MVLCKFCLLLLYVLCQISFDADNSSNLFSKSCKHYLCTLSSQNSTKRILSADTKNVVKAAESYVNQQRDTASVQYYVNY